MGKALVVLTMGWALSARTAPMSPLADTVRRMTADSWWLGTSTGSEAWRAWPGS
jgi:hypothetical protein